MSEIDHIINIAYDRQNGRYVGYNTETGIFATGICVDSAVNAYIAAYYERQANMALIDYAEYNKE